LKLKAKKEKKNENFVFVFTLYDGMSLPRGCYNFYWQSFLQ